MEEPVPQTSAFVRVISSKLDHRIHRRAPLALLQEHPYVPV